MPPAPRPWRYDVSTGRYRGPDGRFLPRTRQRNILDTALASSSREMKSLGEQLRTRQITLPQWEREMRTQIKAAHLANGAMARGGFKRLGPREYGRIGAQVKEQYRYLAKFAREIEAGLPLDGRFLNRTGMYAQAGRGTFHKLEQAEMADLGMTEERNVLHPADHCAGCLGETALGWVPIGDLVPIGSRDCRANDRCTIEYR